MIDQFALYLGIPIVGFLAFMAVTEWHYNWTHRHDDDEAHMVENSEMQRAVTTITINNETTEI